LPRTGPATAVTLKHQPIMTRKAIPRLLIIDDDPAILQLMHRLLGAGREVLLARCAADVAGYFGEPAPHVVMLDWKLPDGDGMELLTRLKARWPAAQIIIMSGYASDDIIVEAIKRGAYHFKSKPFVGSDLQRLVDNAFSVWREDYSTDGGPVSQSPKMKDVLRLTARVASNDVSVLITGESGTGKEVLGNLLHARSARANGPLVTINCAALPRELIESELFGVLKGAYTGAVASRHGLLREAEGGTLFLDEISEMPVATQAKLLRVLQQKEFRPVGGTINVKADCRIIAATNREPAKAIAEGQLRADLYYRIGAITIHIPPLRERPEDILPLAQRFLDRLSVKSALRLQGFSPEAQRILQRCAWPGNVRQLENEIQRAVLMCEGNRIEAEDLSPELQPQTNANASVTSPLEEAERDVIAATLRECGGSKRAAAKKLGIARATLQSKLKQYGLQDQPEAQPTAPTRVFASGVN
jgi:two-component system response regulator HydG